MNNYQSESIIKLAESLAKAQGEMGHAHKGADNPFFKSKYSDLSTVIDAARPYLTKNNLSIVQFTDFDESGMKLITMMCHPSGEWIKGYYPIRPIKTDPQAFGSAITYARRYAYQAMVGIASAMDDDDGNAASQGAPQKAAKDIYGTNKAMIDRFKGIQGELRATETHESLKSVWDANKTHISAMKSLDESYYDELVKTKDAQKKAITEQLAEQASYGQDFVGVK
jgi:hypothetical protein